MSKRVVLIAVCSVVLLAGSWLTAVAAQQQEQKAPAQQRIRPI